MECFGVLTEGQVRVRIEGVFQHGHNLDKKITSFLEISCEISC